MSEKNLVICDSEFFYVHFLMENILEREELVVSVHACTSWEAAEKLLQETEADILLVEETWKELALSKKQARQIVVLTTDKPQADDKAIYKYQCADAIIAALFEKENVFRTMREEKQRLLAVYSPIHRAGKTTFAVGLGKMLAKNQKVLYINLEEYPGFKVEEEDNNLGALLYYMKQECAGIGLRLSAMVRQDERLDYLPGIPMCSDLKEVTLEEWQLLLEKLEKSNYQTIILDMGESVQGLYEILELCDKIYMPVLSDDISRVKLARYEQNLQQQGLDSLLQKTSKMEAEEYTEEWIWAFVKEEF